MENKDYTGLPSSTGNLNKLIEQFKGPIQVGMAGTTQYDGIEIINQDFYIINELRRDRKVLYFIEGYDIISKEWISFDYPAQFIMI